MRPIRLRMNAFGPYAEVQELDFRDLGEARLFLIHGSTGAGKSTILDAICFALYGQTSGEEREPRHMRSDFAAPDAITEVTFDFMAGAETYRVTRRPDQLRPAKRGGGMTEERHTATLWRRTHCETDDAEGEVLATRVHDINALVSDVLGVGANEFRRIVMLPQGRFREMLSLPAGDRQKILQTLFQTAVYKRIEEGLKQRAKDSIAAMANLRRDEGTLLHRAEADSIDDLRARKKDVTMKIQTAEKTFRQLKAKETAARKGLEKGRRDREKLKKLAEAQTALKALQNRLDEHQQDKKVLSKAKRAQTVEPHHGALCAEETFLRKKRQEEKDANGTLQQAKQNRATAQTILDQETSHDKEREAERTKLQDLRGMRSKVGALQMAVREKARLDGTVKTARKRLERKQTDLADRARKLKERRDAVATAEKQEGELKARRIIRDGLTQSLDSLQEIEAMEVGVAADEKALATKKKKTERLQRDVATARTRLKKVESAWTRGQAAILAQALHDDEPCPVCGSTDHPRPAAAAADIPDQETLQAARTSVRESEAELARHQRSQDKDKADLDNLKQNLADALKKLGKKGAADKGVVTEKLGAAEMVVAEAKAAAKSLPKLREDIKALEKAHGEAKKAVETAQTELQKDEQNSKGALTLLREREGQVPKHLRNPKALGAAKRAAEKRLEALETALTDARNAHAEANSDVAGATAGLKSATKARKEATRRYAKAERRFKEALKKAGFANAGAFLDALFDAEDLKELEISVETFQREHRAAQVLKENAAKEADGITPPDLNGLEIAFATAEGQRSDAQNTVTNLKNVLTQTKGWIAEFGTLREKFSKLEKRHRVEGLIANVAAGDNEKRLSFERYVLAALLDDVLAAANQRLDIMSRHRYLMRRHEDVEDRRQLAGLNLDVLDSYTDKPRPVATLSGGEGFLAAFCLALGVADVVEAYSGGTVIETMFIDEGFGNLDSEALDAAIQALVSLQSEGRLVGIISHVSELRERIDACLEVTSTKVGSRARFVVA